MLGWIGLGIAVALGLVLVGRTVGRARRDRDGGIAPPIDGGSSKRNDEGGSDASGGNWWDGGSDGGGGGGD